MTKEVYNAWLETKGGDEIKGRVYIETTPARGNILLHWCVFENLMIELVVDPDFETKEEAIHHFNKNFGRIGEKING